MSPPPWLTQVCAVLAESRDPATAAAWTRRIDGAVGRLGGQVPFRVVYAWHARIVRAAPAVPAIQRLGCCYTRALTGDRVTTHQWRAALRPVLRGLYRASYPYAKARQAGHANALAYANANGYRPDEAAEFADYYADLSTAANARAYAEANAIANAEALASALAGADADAYAATYPGALVRAYVLAQVHGDEATDPIPATQRAYGRLADALAASLADGWPPGGGVGPPPRPLPAHLNRPGPIDPAR